MKYLSKVTTLAGAGLLILGVFQGESMYQHRSRIPETHVAGSNAITLHILLAVVLALAIAVSVFYRIKAPAKPYSFWAAPFTTNALRRVTNTLLLRRGLSVGNALRALVVLFLVFSMAFYFFRAGMQVLGSADPNFVTNAWGGPSRTGASLAHWMDAVYLFYAEAGLVALFAVGATVTTKKSTSKKR